jgi:D-xylose transport system substrate-binding protein
MESRAMQLNKSRKWVALTLSIGAVLTVGLLAGCGGTTAATGANGGKGCTHVAFLLPESATAARWEAADHPLTEAAIKQYLPGATVDVVNAQGSAATQQSQAESELTKGACILVVAPKDSDQAAAIVAKAKASDVPVIAYDRLIQSSDLAYYVSFDGNQVGVLQGQYIAAHYTEYAKGGAVPNVVMIDGSPTDNNATLFGKGAHSILDPLFTANKLKKVYEQATPDWDNAKAQAEMEAALTANNNNVQIAYVMNDGMANTSIAALKAQGLAGKVLVTGQDAEVSGIRNILLGDQSMTIYKPIKKLGDAVGRLVAAISKGDDTKSIASATITTSTGAAIPSVLNDVTSVDKTNIATTVIADNFVSKADVCQGVPAGTDGVC